MKTLPQEWVEQFVRVKREVLPVLRRTPGAELHALLCGRDLHIAAIVVDRGDLAGIQTMFKALKEWRV